MTTYVCVKKVTLPQNFNLKGLINLETWFYSDPGADAKYLIKNPFAYAYGLKCNITKILQQRPDTSQKKGRKEGVEKIKKK